MRGAPAIEGIPTVQSIAVLSLVLVHATLADSLDRVLPAHMDHVLAPVQGVAAPNSLNPHVLRVAAVRFQGFVRGLRCVGLLGVGVAPRLPVGCFDIPHGLDRLDDLLTIDGMGVIVLGVLVLSLLLSVTFHSLVKILRAFHFARIAFVGLVQFEKLIKFRVEVDGGNRGYLETALVGRGRCWGH